MIEIQVNSQSYKTDPQSTIESLLKELSITKEGTAVAVNNQVIPRSEHGEFRLSEGDTLEIIRAVGGG